MKTALVLVLVNVKVADWVFTYVAGFEVMTRRGSLVGRRGVRRSCGEHERQRCSEQCSCTTK